MCSTTSTGPNTSRRVSDSSRDYRKQICTCREGDGGKSCVKNVFRCVGGLVLFTYEFSTEHRGTRDENSQGHAHLRSTDTPGRVKRSKRKKSRRRRKKASKRESDRPRHDCFARLCVCVRGRGSDELRASKCTSSREIPPHRDRYSVKVNLQ